MMHKKGKFTRLLACFLAIIMMISVPVAYATEDGVVDSQEDPEASEYSETETKDMGEITDPASGPDEPGDDVPGTTDPDVPGTDDSGDDVPGSDAGDDLNQNDSGDDEQNGTNDLPESSGSADDPDGNLDGDEPEEEAEDEASTEEEEEAEGETEEEEEAEGETEEITVEEFLEFLSREVNNRRALDIIPDTMYVEPSETNGLTETVKLDIACVTKTTSGSTYTFNVTCTLPLPDTAVVSECKFSWVGTLKARYNRRDYESGQCPVRSDGQTGTYTFTKNETAGGQKFIVNYNVITDTMPPAMWIKSSKTNGLADKVYVEITNTANSTQSGTSVRTYTCDLFLPFGAVLENCKFSWRGELAASVDNQSYANGECPIPAAGETKTYSFSSGSRIVRFVINAYYALPDAMWVELSDPEQAYTDRIFIKKSSNYGTNYKLEMPFGIPENCCFCWNSDMKATITISGSSTQYDNGQCPIPPEGQQKTYTFNNGKSSVSFTVTTSVIQPKLRVEKSDTNGIPMQIDVFVSNTSTSGNTTTYTCGLYLPGKNVNLTECFLSWDGQITAKVGTQPYNSGECPIPTPGTTTDYTFQTDSKTWIFSITAYQGSPGVQAVFIDIDESKGTIAAMDDDSDHETECSGTIYINGTEYVLSKMKGRGNATWANTKDKKPYNITLGTAIEFPGVSSGATKKWSFLAEGFDPSLLCNRSGYWLAEQLGIGQSTTSADVWMNGEYQGCYTVTPKTDSFVPSGGFMIEEDNYLEDPMVAGGDAQFTLEGLKEDSGWTSCYNRITVKEMKGDWSPESIQAWLQEAWNAILNIDKENVNNDGYITFSDGTRKHYTDYINIESFAKMYLMHEYVKSYDICAGSLLFYCDGPENTGKLCAGPIWDLDNAMGSVCDNGELGPVADRRSGQGNFIPNVNEQGYKTSFYKTLGQHADFMEEVSRQYRMYSTAFDRLPGINGQSSIIDSLSSSISASAVMNHAKVTVLSGQYIALHKYTSPYDAGNGESYIVTVTDDGRNIWANYVTNLKTYASYRSDWFQNSAYFHEYDTAACVHQYVENITLQPTCTEEGSATYTCSICGKTVVEEIPALGHDYQEDTGSCSRCGAEAWKATIVCDPGASVTVYRTQDLTSGDCIENAQVAYPRNKDNTGKIDCSGDGQINFVVVLENGRELESVTASPSDSYNKLNAQGTNGYRITKVKGDLTITVKVSNKFVTFNTNGHGEAPPRQSVIRNATATEPEAPTAEGYIFRGWYTDAACTTPYEFNTPVTEDITLYAKWEATEPVFTVHSLVLSGEIGVNFFMDLSMLTEEEKADSYVVFTVSGKNGKTIQVPYNSEFMNQSGRYYGFTCYVNSIQMAETISAVYHYGENQTDIHTYSVKQYLEAFDTASGGFDATTVALFHTLGDYGHYIQPFLSSTKGWTIGTDYAEMDKYYTFSYSIPDVTSAVAGYAIVRNNSDPDIEKITYTLAFDSGTDIMVYFKPASGYSGSFTVTVDGSAGEAVRQSDGRYLVTIPRISAHLLNTTHTIVATTDAGSAEVRVSALSYVQGMLSAYTDSRYLDAAAAVYSYSAAAQDYKANH